ncbi:hypothetical protein SASPL_105091 [Salvia splendens]|uniref:Uncharacterized protein n=1 Tax=Salvia splendens TaxID=180675 RepID=A0A8X8YMX8_SALSN|nr:hypothetical protein SASPL_105091 [Salvia splendens]
MPAAHRGFRRRRRGSNLRVYLIDEAEFTSPSTSSRTRRLISLTPILAERFGFMRLGSLLEQVVDMTLEVMVELGQVVDMTLALVLVMVEQEGEFTEAKQLEWPFAFLDIAPLAVFESVICVQAFLCVLWKFWLDVLKPLVQETWGCC